MHRGAWWATVHGVGQLDMTEQLTHTREGRMALLRQKKKKRVVCLLTAMAHTVALEHLPLHLRRQCCCCSVAQSCLTLCDPMNCSTPSLPVPHHLPEFAQVHVHCIGDAVQPSQHQGLYQRCHIRWCWLSYEPCHAGLPKVDGSQQRALTKCDQLEEGIANHPSILALKTSELYKRKQDLLSNVCVYKPTIFLCMCSIPIRYHIKKLIKIHPFTRPRVV